MWNWEKSLRLAAWVGIAFCVGVAAAVNTENAFATGAVGFGYIVLREATKWFKLHYEDIYPWLKKVL